MNLIFFSPTGAWIITEGLREGVGKCVGEAVRDHATAASSGSSNKVVAVGIASWGLVYNKEQLINPEVVQKFTHKHFSKWFSLRNLIHSMFVVFAGQLSSQV